MNFFFTLISLNHFAQYPEKFREDRARRKVGAIRMALSLVGTVIGYVIPPFFIEYGDPSSYMRMVWIFAFFSLIIFGSTIPGHRESKELKLKYIRIKLQRTNFLFGKRSNFH